jgi:antitoxin VapB
MALQIANSTVVGKVECLARAMGISKTAVVEQAVDLLAKELQEACDPAGRMVALLAQLDRIPDREDASDPLEWDEQGLPR